MRVFPRASEMQLHLRSIPRDDQRSLSLVVAGIVDIQRIATRDPSAFSCMRRCVSNGLNTHISTSNAAARVNASGDGSVNSSGLEQVFTEIMACLGMVTTLNTRDQNILVHFTNLRTRSLWGNFCARAHVYGTLFIVHNLDTRIYTNAVGRAPG